MEARRGRVRGALLALLGMVVVGIGGALYYGDLDLGSLAKSGATQPIGNAWAYLPVGLGSVMVIVGISLVVNDRRKVS